MARMLQALKNLEARSTQRPSPSPPLPASAPTPAGAAESLASEPVTPALTNPGPEVASHIDFAVAALANLSISVNDSLWTGPGYTSPTYDFAAGSVTSDVNPGPTQSAPPLPTKSAAPLVTVPKLVTSPPASGYRSTTFEKAALRILTDPIRARPLVELAERFDSDVKQTGSRTLLLAGVGTADDVHHTLLYSGILLTERQPGDVLLVDADWSRRLLTAAFERDGQRGFGELIDETASIAEVCYPTATGRLFFLPAGQRHLTDLSTAGSRLEAALRKLTGRFAIVLIDGGHTGDLGSSALARQPDATYLVVRLGAVEAAAAQAALRDFRASGARILGCIAT